MGFKKYLKSIDTYFSIEVLIINFRVRLKHVKQQVIQYLKMHVLFLFSIIKK